MENGSNSLITLETRHRKEKKELQAQIQALKKAAKNDKTKKKELTAEIIRLESELEVKHQQELDAFEPSPESEDNEQIEEINTDNTKIKLSKAQKRRDKKLQQDREREEQIKLQEKENLNGPRNKEIQTITAKLKVRKLKILSIPSDGDCLYKAVSHQLTLKKEQELSVGELRSKVASYIRENKDEFIPFMSNPETCDMLSDTEFEDYCDKIRDTKVWGGQPEIRALSNSLKCPINIIQATGPEIIEQGKEFAGPALLITYHRHMYQLGEHYNSTMPLDDGSDE